MRSPLLPTKYHHPVRRRARRRTGSGVGVGVLAVLAAVVVVATSCSSGGSRAGEEGTGGDSSSTTNAASSTSSGPAVGVGCVGRLDGPTTEAYANVPGVDPDRLSVDIYRRPEATGCPVIVWVHGGGWRNGDKQGQAIDTKVAYAGSLGAVLVSVNYRLVGSDDVMWPVFAQDVAAAVDHVLDRAEQLGIDPSKVVLMGHSAGAHLVSILGTDPDLLAGVGRSRDDVRCVVSLDTASYDIRHEMLDTRALVVPAFGEDPATLADASPLVQAQRHPDGLPDFLIVERGTPSRRAQADSFAATLRTAGAAVTVVDAKGDSHADVNRQLGADGETTITPDVTRFLEGCFA